MGFPLLRVLQAGLFTFLTGLPIPGRQRYGIPPGGAMDPESFRIANLLARNTPGALALEITLAGPSLEILADCTLALSGADLSATLNGQEIGNWHAFQAPAGSVLKFGTRLLGARAYLAALGGMAIEREQESSTVVSSPRLAKGDILLGQPSLLDHPLLHIPETDRPSFGDPATLRVLPGPQWDRFSPEACAALVSAEYEVSHESNRVGIRLKGAPLAFAPGAKADIVSEPTPVGAIQVPASGLPILLMEDGPTTGGYAKIATVISADLSAAGQLVPGNRVRFTMTTLAEAQAAARALEARLHLLEQMATWPR